jgi:hypothetical protein
MENKKLWIRWRRINGLDPSLVLPGKCPTADPALEMLQRPCAAPVLDHHYDGWGWCVNLLLV